MAASGESGIELERRFENIIGDGSFGVVYKGRLAGRDVAVKVINRHWNHKYWEKLKNEAILLVKNLRHPNVIEILKYEDKYPPMPEVWIAMELCKESLESYLENNSLDDPQILDVLWQCAKGLSFLHENHLVHRDIKVDNILIKLENSSNIMKVTDFSLSKDIEGIEEESRSTTIHGNNHWIAPEMFDDEGYKAKRVRFTGSSLQKIDVFSFALIILYTCLTKEGRKAMCEKYKLGLYVKLGKDVFSYFHHQWNSDRLKQIVTPLLQKMLSVNAEDRPSMEEVCQFFTSHVTPRKVSTAPRLEPPTASTAPRLEPPTASTAPRLEPPTASTAPRLEPPTAFTAPRLEPPTASTAPRLVLQTSHRLGYLAHWAVGIGGRHLILLGCPHTLRLLQLQGDYKQLWRKYCPQGVDYRDRKCVAGDDSLITRAGFSDPTRWWSRELAPLHTHTVGGNRELRAVLPNHTLVYREQIDGVRQLVLCDGERLVCTLRPPAGTRWGVDLSICQHPASGWMAVTDCYTGTLTVFDRAGQLQHHARLEYKPGVHNAITSTAAHLVVREWPTTVLHVHAWDGKEVGRVNLRQVAELEEGEKYVYSVGVCEDVLHVAVGGNYVSSLHALRVQ